MPIISTIQSTPIKRRTLDIFFVVNDFVNVEDSYLLDKAIYSALSRFDNTIEDKNEIEIKIAVQKFSDTYKWSFAYPIRIHEYVEKVKFDTFNSENDHDVKMLNCDCNLSVALEGLEAKLHANRNPEDDYYLSGFSYPPLIFIIISGKINDDYQQNLKLIWSNKWYEKSIKVAFCVGNVHNSNTLYDLTRNADFNHTINNVEELSNIIRQITEITCRYCGGINIDYNNVPDYYDDYDIESQVTIPDSLVKKLLLQYKLGRSDIIYKLSSQKIFAATEIEGTLFYNYGYPCNEEDNWQYHVLINREKLKITISSYKGVLVKKVFSIGIDDFTLFLSNLSKRNICKVKERDSLLCGISGYSRWIKLSNNNVTLFSAYSFEDYDGDLYMEGDIFDSINEVFPWYREELGKLHSEIRESKTKNQDEDYLVEFDSDSFVSDTVSDIESFFNNF